MRKILFLLAISFSISINAQKHELGKVTTDELKQKMHPTDTSAVAAILFKTGEVSFEYSQQDGFFIKTNIKAKIKIYKKDGYDWGNFEMLLYNEVSAKQTLDIKSAYTYNLLGDKIEKFKLKSDGEFVEKVNEYWTKKKITMPNVKEGSIIEIEYTIKDEGTGLIDEWTFQEEIPVDFSEYTTLIPEYYVYNTHFVGWLTTKIVTEEQRKSIELRSKERTNIGGRMQNSNINVEQISYKFKKSTYTLEQIPGIKNESFTNNIKNYTASVVLELSMTMFPNQMTQSYSSDWETVTKKIYEYSDFGPELNKTGYFEKELTELLNGKTAQAEKVAIVFDFVKNRMNWNERYGYSCQLGVKKAYQDMTGNVADINLMLISMLRYAGLDANPILISTRSNGIALYPSRSAFNYVIAGIEVENQIILLDATNKYSLPGVLPIRDLNWFGRIIRNNGSSTTVSLTPQKKSIDAKFVALEALALVVEHAFIRLGMEVVWSGHAYPGLRNWIIKTGLLGFRINGLLPCEFVHGTFVSDAVRTSITKYKFDKLIKQRGQLWPGQQVVSKLVNSIKGNEDFFEKVILNISKQNEKYDMYWEEKESKII